MKIIVLEILNKLRYVACLPVLLAIGLITSPLTLLFGWQGYWILYIANEECCSLSKAKKIFLEGVKYPDLCKHTNSTESEPFSDCVYSSTRSYLPDNIYHDRSIKDD